MSRLTTEQELALWLNVTPINDSYGAIRREFVIELKARLDAHSAALAKYSNRHNWLGLEEVSGQPTIDGGSAYVWMPGGEEENGWEIAEKALEAK